MPVFAAIGAVAGVVGVGASFLGGQEKNKQAERSAGEQNEYNEEMWEWNNEEAARAYEFKKEGLEISKRNNEINLQYQEAMSIQQYSSAMAARNYTETEKYNAWGESISQATEQVSFNAMASVNANAQQDRAMHEQVTGLMYDSKQTLQDFGMATMGLNMKRKTDRASGAVNVQQQRLAGLKAGATQKAKGGSGRSATKAVIGLMAESGARQADIVQQILFNEQGLDLDLTKLKEQLYMDKAMIASTAENLNFNDKSVRVKILQDLVQADMNAMASILTKPTALPPIPKPLVMPRAEYQELLRPTKPPKPGEVIPQTTNPWYGLASSVAGGVAAGATGATGAAGGKSFNWGNFFGGL